MRKENRVYLLVIMVLLLLVLCLPTLCYAEEPGGHPPGMAVFTDNNVEHVYLPGSNISFTIGPFPCQAGQTDKVVMGIMGLNDSGFDVSKPVFPGMQQGTVADLGSVYYQNITADEKGYFAVAGTVNNGLAHGILAIKLYNSAGDKIIKNSLGIDAYVPVVSADNKAAIIVNAEAGGSSTGTSPASAIDSDLDHIYFDGDQIKIKLAMTLPPQAQGMPVKMQVGLFDGEENFMPGIKLFREMKSETTAGGQVYYVDATAGADGVTISGNINNPNNNTLPVGAIGVKLLASGLPGVPDRAMPVLGTGDNYALAGIKIPDGMTVIAEPNLAQTKNLYNTEQSIVFTKSGQGSITFNPGVNIAGSKDQLTNLDTGINIDFIEGQFTFMLKSDSLQFLAGKGAAIEIFNIGQKLNIQNLTADNFRDQFKYTVIDNQGNQVGEENTDNYLDRPNIAYDAANDVLTVPVKHFTTYKIGKSLIPAPEPPDNNQYQVFSPQAATTDISDSKVWRIKFSQAVDKATLDQICMWRTDVSSRMAVDPVIDPTDPALVMINHTQPFAKGAAYALYIGPGLKDTNGTVIKQAIRMTFFTKA